MSSLPSRFRCSWWAAQQRAAEPLTPPIPRSYRSSQRPTRSSSSPSESPAPELEPQVNGVVIQVLNGTTVTGLGAEVEQLLVGRGYVAGLPAGDADNKPVGTTTVYFRTGADADQNEVDAENLARRFLKGVEADVRPLNATLSPDIAPKTQLVVIVGTDYADAQAAA